MLAEESYIKSITTYLSIFSDYIETLSSINLHDASVVAENFCAKLMNLAFSLELDNANHLMKNAEVIDLYDTLNKVSVQVTSNKKLDKIKGCLNAFIEKELYEE
ncbi:SMEK domain-containing protein, partial [Vibrio harveyi]|nr:SMEK domain-containing protein [Vibrio harveyi]